MVCLRMRLIKFSFLTSDRVDGPASVSGHEILVTALHREDAMRRLFLILCLLLPVTALQQPSCANQTRCEYPFL